MKKVLTLIALPMLLAFTEEAAFFVRSRNNGSIVSSGERREYLLYVPRGYDRSRPTPLVISMHGAGGWPVQQMELDGWNRLAEKERFVVVYPSAFARGRPRIWRVGPGEELVMKDARFISDLIDKLAATYNIDRRRIYASGVSNGGGMSFALSCTLSDRIAAVGMVAAAQTLPWRWCTDRRAVPMIAFHGTDDPVIPYNGGVSWIASRSFPNVPIWIANWARRNRCASTPIETEVAADVVRREYQNCADDAAVALYTIRGGGHTWPGGQQLEEWFIGRTSRSVDATSEMWRFFRAHPLLRNW